MILEKQGKPQETPEWPKDYDDAREIYATQNNDWQQEGNNFIKSIKYAYLVNGEELHI